MKKRKIRAASAIKLIERAGEKKAETTSRNYTFRFDMEEMNRFERVCEKHGLNMTEALKAFIHDVISGNG